MYIKNNYNLSDDIINKYSEQSVKYAERSSDREKIAQKVERESEDIKKAEYMQSKIGNEYEGVISSITSFGMFVELYNTVEGLIRLNNLSDDYYIFDQENYLLFGEHTKKTFKIGDKINIKVDSVNIPLREVNFVLA